MSHLDLFEPMDIDDMTAIFDYDHSDPVSCQSLVNNNQF